MSVDEQMVFKIGIIGPTRVGKTSLITSILSGAQKLLAGTPLTMKPRGRATAQRLAMHRRSLEGSLLAGEFNPGGLKGTEEYSTFELEIDSGVEGANILLTLLDYPGGWVDPATRPEGRENDWKYCMQWLKESSVLLVPIDAAVLMEAAEARHRRAVPFILTTPDVTEVVRDWAKARNKKSNEPALLVMCPLKCESYFADNGGHRDHSEKLLREVERIYREVLGEIIRKDAPHAKVIYSPVDTIGCVEIVNATWKEEQHAPGGFEFSADYRVRYPEHQSVKGSDSVLIALCKHLVSAKIQRERHIADKRHQEAREAKDYAEQDEGFFGNFWLWISGGRNERREDADDLEEQALEQQRVVKELERVVTSIATMEYGPRVREL